ncbi:hypothetical protein GCM10010329_09850 [Streptomyces spiroverticillatus]|uniref:LigA protein n=1 Tax=Streptomyces finlayi TaxID=67296 RepID=A0A919CA32_9ACTN|nr:hypothetical protein [Streptomyces finlayi]GGZ91481.1 hypothetical protein GCM10010329_09850 [Streptomyces spiroverticillatus]GHC93768.1 hypothetical protein GCM10010334_31230 [Streptomyces finlayi]
MTSTPLTPPRPTAPSSPVRALRALAVVACVPYLALKVTWIAGGRLGIPDGSALLKEPTLMAVANSVTVLMDTAVVVLALLLTQGWGRRVPGALLALPMWAASGLLAPIMAGFPLQLLFGDSSGVAPPDETPFLDAWVFAVVYGGFLAQGLALGALFVRYARQRWGHLWRGPVAGLPRPDGRVRTTGFAAAVLAAVCCVPHLLAAFGAGAHGEALTVNARLVSGVHGAFALAAVAGLLMLALRLGGRTPLAVALALAWTGVGVLGSWGGWMLATGSLVGSADRAPLTDLLTYAVQVIIGLLALVGGTSLFARLRQQREHAA